MSPDEIEIFDDTADVPITDVQQVNLKEALQETLLDSRYLSITPQSHSQQSSLSSELHTTALTSPISDKTAEHSSIIQKHILPVIDAAQGPEPLRKMLCWEHKSTLTCDGGGIRGYASLLMIAALMRYIGEAERSGDYGEPHDSSFCPSERISEGKDKEALSTKIKIVDTSKNDDQAKSQDVKHLSEMEELGSKYLPCHYFDYMIGTSTGGLIAVMLSRWRMSVKEALEKYEIFGAEIFDRSRRKFSIMGWPHNKHHKQQLIDVLKLVTDQRTPHRAPSRNRKFRIFDSPNDLCRTAVVSVQKSKDGTTQEVPFIFRSYSIGHGPYSLTGQPRNSSYSRHPEIWEVCRATTAAPFYFKAHVIGEDEFSDGGTEANNPIKEAFREIRSHHKNSSKLFASFGTADHSRGY